VGEVDPRGGWITMSRAEVETLEQFASCWEGPAPPPPGQCTVGARSNRYRYQVERDHCGAQVVTDADAERHHRHRRRTELPVCDCCADRGAGGSYALALKPIRKPVRRRGAAAQRSDPEASQSTMLQMVEADHGRIEMRTATVSTEVQ